MEIVLFFIGSVVALVLGMRAYDNRLLRRQLELEERKALEENIPVARIETDFSSKVVDITDLDENVRQYTYSYGIVCLHTKTPKL